VLNAPRTLALAQASDFENLLTARVLEQREADGVMRVALSGGGELEVPLSTAQIGELVVVAIHAGDVLLATELPRGLSARNILQGLVEAVETRGTLLALKVRAGAVYHVHVTPGAARSLSLQVGRQVWLVVKTHSCHLVSPL
jgi:molybdate transport system ATP-binding protein